jgi:hypothetical protein
VTPRTYVIDNDRGHSDHSIYFVEADPAVMEPLLAAYQKAWPRVCRGCGVERPRQWPPYQGPATLCPKPFSQGWPYHGYYEAHHVVFVADQLEWRVDKRMPIGDWLDCLVTGLDDEVADLGAAEEFKRLTLAVNPDLYFSSLGFSLRQPPRSKP